MKSKKILIFSIIILLICTCTESNFDGVDETTKWFQGGNNAGDKKEYDKAIECYQKAIEINPDFADAYYNMGIAYRHKENYDKAIECYQKVIEIDPEDADAYNNMGVAYCQKGMKISAADYLYKAGLLYLEQNNRQLVLKTLDAMKNFTPDSPLIQRLMDKLYKE